MIHLGRWQDALADVDMVDALICDPPYGARTHDGHNAAEKQTRAVTGQATRTAIDYASFTNANVVELVSSWASRCRGWLVCMTSHDLIGAYEGAYEKQGFYGFPPVPIIQKRPRLVGDGPSSWAVYLMVARPRSKLMATWGCLPGAYEAPTVKDAGMVGCKPLWLMQAIVRDYSRPGDLVCDPFVGSGTTAVAALSEGRRFIGAEAMPEHHAIATRRLAGGFTPSMF